MEGDSGESEDLDADGSLFTTATYINFNIFFDFYVRRFSIDFNIYYN